MLSLATVVVVSSMLMGQVAAKTTMPAQLQEQIEKYFIGDLVFEATFGQQKITGNESWRWGADKSALIIEGCFVEGGKRSPYTCVAGWEAGRASLVVTAYTSDGDMWINRWTEFSPQGWQGTITGTYEGQAYESPCKIAFLGDSVRYEDTTTGKPWVSVGKRPSPGAQNEGEKAFKAYADLAAGGTWIASVDGKQFEDTYELILGGKFMLLTSKAAGEFPASLAVAGVDPITKKFTFWGFNAQRGVSFGTSRLVSEGVWLGEWRGSQPNGSGSDTSRLTKVDNDTVRYEILEQTATGEVKAFPKLTTWKRKR